MEISKISCERGVEVPLPGRRLGLTGPYNPSLYPESKLKKIMPRTSMIVPDGTSLVVENKVKVEGYALNYADEMKLGFVWTDDEKTLRHVSIDASGEPVEKELANFQLKFLQKVITVTNEGESASYVYLLTDGSKRYTGKVKEKNLKDFPKSYLGTEPSLYWLSGNENLARKYLALKFKEFERQMTPKYEYELSGWHRLSGRYVYMNKAIPCCTSMVSLNVDCEAAKRFLDYFFKALNPKKAALLLTYASYGYVAKLVNYAGLPGCNAVLQVVGCSGVGKTAICSVLANGLFIKKEDAPVLRYDATRAYLESRIKEFSDSCLVLDDLFMSADKAEARNLQENANMIARLMGDLAHRGKCGQNRQAQEPEAFWGSIISTAEALQLPSYSSYARSIVLALEEGDVKFDDSLTILQTDRELTRAWFSCFVKAVEDGQVAWLKSLPNRVHYHSERLEVAGIKQKRFLAAAAMLLTIAETVAGVAAYVGYSIPVDIADELTQHFIRYSDELTESKPEKIVASALVYAVQNQSLKIADSEAAYKYVVADGFYADGNKIVIDTLRLDDVMTEFAQRKHVTVPWKTHGIKEKLVKLGAIIKRNDEIAYRYTKDRQVKPKRRNVICFDYEKIEELAYC